MQAWHHIIPLSYIILPLNALFPPIIFNPLTFNLATSQELLLTHHSSDPIQKNLDYFTHLQHARTTQSVRCRIQD